MNIPFLKQKIFWAQRQGVALIIVLSLLVLIAVLMVGFFTSVTADLSTTKSYVTEVSTRQLSDSAVNLVMAQIAQGAVSSGTQTWSSQPGLIRTFDNAGGLGKFYKLYSSDSLVVNGASFSATDEAPSSTWNQQPSLYTDLNSPVLVSDSYGNITGTDGASYTAVFPIIDGNYLVDGSKLNPAVPANKPDSSATYLTYDAPTRDSNGAIVEAADGVADIDGFYVESPSTYNGNNTQISATNNSIPMPVKWLYVLQNGKIIAPAETAASGSVADFSSASTQPTAQNPIVGRIAFWTDDETCKININTAAGDEKIQYPITPKDGITFGSFWDIPRANTWVERGDNNSTATFQPGLAWSQPYKNEFQRYPGHPATVALNTVFPTLTRAEIGAIVPRVESGGSLGGTVQLEINSSKASAVSQDTDRLYASVDELLFKPALSGGTRPLNQSDITRDKLEQSKFFLTANSRAPDLNLFGQPRITIWPINNTIGESSQDTYCTSQDKLIAFCSTIGNKRYYFTRQDSTSPTNDYDNISRNKELYAYLQNLTAKKIPGNNGSGTFLTKYPKDRDQILTEIFDYIRCANLVDVNLSSGDYFTNPGKTGLGGSGQVVPIQISTSGTTTMGFGRFPTLMEAAIQFYVDGITTVDGTSQASSMKAVLLLKLFDPMLGYAEVYPYLDERVTFSNGSSDWNVTISGSTYSLNFPTGQVTNAVITGTALMDTRAIGGDGQGLTEQFVGEGNTLKTLGNVDDNNHYPFCSTASIPLPLTSATTFQFSGGSATLELTYHGQSTTIQKINLTFPASATGKDWPLPIVSTTNPNQYTQSVAPYDWRIQGLNTHGAENSSPPAHPWWSDILDTADTIRALEPVGASTFATSPSPSAPYGDIRLISLNPDLTSGAKAQYFAPHKNYYDNTLRQAHSFRISSNFIGTGDSYVYNSYVTTGQLVSTSSHLSTNVNSARSPIMTNGIYDVRGDGSFAGDFDNGPASWPDGPYANKPDEGDIRGISSTNTYEYEPYFYSITISRSSAYFSPNREMSSAIMFGSLPSGVLAEKPWQTLLFRPDPDGTHPGSQSPKDYYLLDLFTMPIVEPYAISEPFSTAGRINLNYQLMPFGKAITRETGMRSVLESTWIMNIPYSDMQGTIYKISTKNDNSGNFKNYRYPIALDTTLKYLSDRFTDTSNTNYNRNFVSASEICDVDLYPASLTDGTCTTTDMDTYWSNTLTGDNSREAPYSHLYPLLTTKSNTYTVYVRAQTLKQVKSGRNSASDWAKWTEDKDQVLGEWRGATEIERYIDPNDTRLSSGSVDPDNTSLDSLYKFRVLSVKRFNP